MFHRRRHISYNCSFCGKAQDQVQRLIAGPGDVYVCNECTIAFLEGNTGPHKDSEAAARENYRCSFCGKKRTQVQRLIAGSNGVNICDQCIDLCCEIIEGEQLR